MTALSLNKIKTHHAVVDVLSGGNGPDLFFLHGAGGVTAEDPFLTALAQKYRVHAPLLPGYGASDECESIRTMLDFTLHSYDVLDALGLRKPIVVGHSMGGMMAAEMAAIAPHDIDRLGCGWMNTRCPTSSRWCPTNCPPCCFTTSRPAPQ